MVNERLLKKDLQFWFKDIPMESIKYNKNLFPTLFKKFNHYEMAEYSFCCRGLETSCWTELISEGNWGLTLDSVKRNILDDIKWCKKYLYNGKKYGTNRLHYYENNEVAHVYIYMRDILGMDLNISFWNE